MSSLYETIRSASALADVATVPPPSEGEAAAWLWLQSELGGSVVPPVLAVIGLGNAELLGALERHAPETKVLALEPCEAHAHAFLAAARWSGWHESGRLIYLTAPDFAGAEQAWRIFPAAFTAPALLVHPGVEPGAMVRQAAEVLRKIVTGAEANAKARRTLAPRYLVNALRNVPAMMAGSPVSVLSGRFKGVPAIVVGAGPSLDRHYDDLRAAAGRALIIATDTALRPLLAHGVTPHLVVGLDPTELNARHLLALPQCGDTWLVAEMALDRRATAAFDDRTLWCRVAEHHPWPWLRSMGLEAGWLEVWGSVLTGAFQTACLAGCDRVIAVGADLSFPDGRPYARGTTYEFDWAWSAGYGTAPEEIWREQSARADREVHQDLTGARTLTTPVMLSFRDWMVTQARKRGTRLINATGSGMLFGDHIEQARLLDVIADRVEVPSIRELTSERRNLRPSAIARQLKALSHQLRRGNLTSPLDQWVEFSAGGFEAATVIEALDSAAMTVETKRGKPAAPFAIPWNVLSDSDVSSDVFTRLPELTSRLRAALEGTSELPGGEGPDLVAMEVLLSRSLELLRVICHDALKAPDLEGWPNPELIGTVPAGGICLWPDTTRWAVGLFEGLLGKAWKVPVAAAGLPGVPCGPVSWREVSGRQSGMRAGPARPRTTQACLLLAIEWLRCAATAERAGDEGLQGAIARLSSLAVTLSSAPAPVSSTGPMAVLEIERPGLATGPLMLPLGVPEPALARLCSGAMQMEGEAAWEIGRQDGPIAARVSIKADVANPSVWRRTSVSPVVPRVLTDTRRTRTKVVDQVAGGALCVEPFACTTLLVGADGNMVPYQSWPRPITGAISLGPLGEVAWSGAVGKGVDCGPYLMYRPHGDSDVQIQTLAFRPSTGLWWRGRVYFTCLPMEAARGGVATWVPGEDATVEWPDLSLMAILPRSTDLALEPYVPGVAERPSRRQPPHRFSWTPGEAPLPCALGGHGTTSSVALHGRWTAAAHPHEDVVSLTSTDGEVVAMRCCSPLRVAWSGDSLVVSTIEQELMMFDQLALRLERGTL